MNALELLKLFIDLQPNPGTTTISFSAWEAEGRITIGVHGYRGPNQRYATVTVAEGGVMRSNVREQLTATRDCMMKDLGF
jgi:hypothetical protein